MKNIYILTREDYDPFKLEEFLQEIAKKSDEKDLVFFYYGGHGGKRGIGISYEKIGKLLNKIKSKTMVIGIDCCYSGSAIPYLKGENRVIVTSSAEDEMSRASIDLLGFASSLPQSGIYCGTYYKGADKNKDGIVSLKEWFYFMKKEIELSYDQHPQIYDPKNLSDKIYLGIAYS